MVEPRVSYAATELKSENTEEQKTLSGIKCPHCGAAISEDCEICPTCGHRLVSYCTFCGAPMEWSDDECPECGAPATGIVCPSCGALSHRPFCPKCGIAITKAASRMVETAKKDLIFQTAVAQNAKVEELELRLERSDATDAPQILQELIKVTDDLNSTFARMLPPAGSTPQEKRNYYCARKVAVTTCMKRRIRVGWVCNYCGCTHDRPSECTKPFLGGTWKYETVTTTRTDYIKK